MDDDVSTWINQLAQGDELAAQKIWDRYCQELLTLARKKLGGGQRRVADEEDAVLSAFHSFFRGAAAGRFPRLNDRNDLLRLLVTITTRKVSAHKRHGRREKRGGGAVRGESVFARAGSSGQGAGIEQMFAKQPTPEFLAVMTEQCSRLLKMLQGESLRTIALCKFEGYSNLEIAQKLDCSLRTVERKLQLIRMKWDPSASLRGQSG